MLDFLITVHVVGAVVWVGGSVTLHIIGRRVLKRGDPHEIFEWSKEVNKVSMALFLPVSLALLVAGILLVTRNDTPYEFSDTFISIGLAGFLVSFLLGVGYYGPQDKKLQKLVAEKGENDPGVVANVRQAVLVNSIELSILLLVVVDMTTKPGFP